MNPYLALEQPLIDLRTMAGLLEHMSTSDRTADRASIGPELAHIVGILLDCHEDITTVRDAIGLDWPATIHDAVDAEVATLKAELAACQASHAPPGSASDVESAKTCWWLLVSAARTVLDEASEAGMMPVKKPVAEGDGA